MSPQNLIDWAHLSVLTIAQGFLLHEVGLLSLGTAGLCLVGAYSFGYVALGLSAPWGLVIVVGFALVASAPALRVRNEVFAVITLALATIGQRFAVGAGPVTGGSLGLGPLTRPAWMTSDAGAFGLAATAIAVLGVAYVIVGRTSAGLVLGGTRDNEILVRSIGTSPVLVRVTASLGAMLAAGLAGALMASYFGLVTPQMGTLDVTLRALAAAMLARPFWRQGSPLSTLGGYVAASGVLVLLPPATRAVFPDVSEAVLRQVLFGAALYALVHPQVRRRLERR